jgi:UDP-glucose 4-epimerase
LASVHNARSLVSVWNLCDLLETVCRSPAAPGGVWMVSDGEDLSTPGLILRMGAAMNRSVNLFPVPQTLLELGGTLLGRRAEVSRLCGSLAVDIAPTRSGLNWSPPLSVDESLQRTVHWYLAGKAKSAT